MHVSWLNTYRCISEIFFIKPSKRSESVRRYEHRTDSLKRTLEVRSRGQLYKGYSCHPDALQGREAACAYGVPVVW